MPIRALYIEDNLDSRVLVRRVLRAAGFELHEATTAAEGIAMAQQVVPDVILIDINMPEVDGLSATRALREIPSLHNVAIVAVTANVMHDVLQRALKSGCDGYIEKPIKIDDFPDQVMSFIARRRSS